MLIKERAVKRPKGRVEVELYDSETNELIEKINTSNNFVNDGLVALARTLVGAAGSTITHMGLSGMPTDAYVTGKNRYKLESEYTNSRIPISKLNFNVGEENTLTINVSDGINEINLRDYSDFTNDLYELVSLRKIDSNGNVTNEWFEDQEAEKSVLVENRHILKIEPAISGSSKLEVIYRNNAFVEIEIEADYKPGVPGFINCPIISDSQKIAVYSDQEDYKLKYPIKEIVDIYDNSGNKLEEETDYTLTSDNKIKLLNSTADGVEFFVKYRRSFYEDFLVNPDDSIYSLNYKISGDILTVYDSSDNLLEEGTDYKKTEDGDIEILKTITGEEEFYISYEYRNGNMNIYEAGLFDGDKKDSTMLAVVNIGPFLKTTKMNAKIRWIITFE